VCGHPQLAGIVGVQSLLALAICWLVLTVCWHSRFADTHSLLAFKVYWHSQFAGTHGLLDGTQFAGNSWPRQPLFSLSKMGYMGYIAGLQTVFLHLLLHFSALDIIS